MIVSLTSGCVDDEQRDASQESKLNVNPDVDEPPNIVLSVN